MILAEMQRDFGAWLRHGDAPDFGARAAAGLDVYQNNYRAQLASCLEASFPQTLKWIGGDMFHAAIVAHVDRVPPSSWTLDAYPRDFPATLALLHPADPEIAELAALEHALDEAFVGADATPVPTDAIGTVDWDRAMLKFAPTLDLLDVSTNADAIWTALADGAVPPVPEHLPESSALLIWRHGFVARFRAIDPGERQALLLARAGTSFAALCATIVAAQGEAEGIEMAGAWLGRWFADGLIVAVYEGETACASPRP